MRHKIDPVSASSLKSALPFSVLRVRIKDPRRASTLSSSPSPVREIALCRATPGNSAISYSSSNGEAEELPTPSAGVPLGHVSTARASPAAVSWGPVFLLEVLGGARGLVGAGSDAPTATSARGAATAPSPSCSNSKGQMTQTKNVLEEKKLARNGFRAGACSHIVISPLICRFRNKQARMLVHLWFFQVCSILGDIQARSPAAKGRTNVTGPHGPNEHFGVSASTRGEPLFLHDKHSVIALPEDTSYHSPPVSLRVTPIQSTVVFLLQFNVSVSPHHLLPRRLDPLERSTGTPQDAHSLPHHLPLLATSPRLPKKPRKTRDSRRGPYCLW